ncbi:MAG: MBL fold metallo-hydrolase, partial [Candidatus Hydrothermarchaeaceae archaeon]
MCTFCPALIKLAQALYAQEVRSYSGGIQIISKGNGIELEIEGVKINLDPRKKADLSFVSHAHSDHVPSSMDGKVLLSSPTSSLISKSATDPHDFGEHIEIGPLKLSIIESGHMLGAGQLLIENGMRAVYTGDLNLKGGATAGKAVVPKCDVLIIEATYGHPRYNFPERAEVVKEIKDWVDDCLKKNLTPALLGYSLGKAQELTKYMSSDFPVAVHESIYLNNKKYEELGVDLGEYSLFEGQCDGVAIMPPAARKTISGEDFCFAFTSGWAIHKGARRRYGAESGFLLTDHCGFDDLIEYVERADPQMV